MLTETELRNLRIDTRIRVGENIYATVLGITGYTLHVQCHNPTVFRSVDARDPEVSCICRHCDKPRQEHSNQGRCLFDTTYFEK